MRPLSSQAPGVCEAGRAMASAGYWREMSGLFQFVQDVGLSGDNLMSFSLRTTSSITRDEDSVLMKVQVLDAAFGSGDQVHHVSEAAFQATKGFAVLRMRFIDYDTLVRHTAEVRVLQAPLFCKGDTVMIDCVERPAFLAGSVQLRAGESLQMAELFSGGFMGWSRAGYVLRACGVSCHTSWCLDADPACIRPAAILEPGLSVATEPSHVHPSHVSPACMFLSAEFDAAWWQCVFEVRPVQLICMSPPCQPWSTAGKRSGLQVPDGQVVLTAARVLSQHKVPVVLLEEVSGFRTHADFTAVLDYWQACGYRCVLQKSLQLSEVSSTTRKRFFLIFRYAPPGGPSVSDLVDSVWQTTPYPSVAQVDAYFEHLPQALLAPCQLTSEVLQHYLSPELCPLDRRGRPRLFSEAYRARPPTEAAECFLAQYHSQHLLPPAHQRCRGLLSTLLRTPAGVRFFASPEIASQHGAVARHFIPANDVDAMRFLGNALATQQATMILALAMQCFQGQVSEVLPAAAVAKALELRLTASNSALVQLNDGWLMCHRSEVASSLLRADIRNSSIRALFGASPMLNCLSLRLRTLTTTVAIGSVRVPVGIPVQLALEWLAVPSGTQAPEWHRHKSEVVLADPLPCHLAVERASVRPACKGALLRLCSSDYMYYVAKDRPDSHHQLAMVYRHLLGTSRKAAACLNVYGDRVQHAEDLPSVTVLQPYDEFLLLEPFMLPLGAVRDAICVQATATLLIAIPEAYALDWWASFPQELLLCLGCACTFDHFPPPPGQPALLSLKAHSLPLQLTPSGLQEWLRRHLVLAVLRQEESAAKSRADPRFRWSLAPCGQALCQRSALVLILRSCGGMWPGVRVYSGPFPQLPQATLRELDDSNAKVQRRKNTGRLVLTFHPEIWGGGSKTEVQAALKSRLAQVCLEKGCALSEVNRAISQVMQKAALSKLQDVLRSETVEEQWLKLVDVLQVQGIKLPLGDEAAHRAARRIQAAARRKQLFQQEVTAADVVLAADFWVLPNSCPAPVLASIVPSAQGVVLMDYDQASRTLPELAGKHFTALAIVSIGHQCHAGSCGGQVQFPVLSRSGEGHILVKGCYHNVGETAIRPALRDSEQVAVADITCCLVQAFGDEWTEDGEWESLCKNPVRTLTEVFRRAGVDQPLLQPWARHFKHNNQPATQHSCNLVQFSAQGIGA